MPSDGEECAGHTGQRLPDRVDEARLVGGTASCDCGFVVRFSGNESHDVARSMWFSDDHKEEHDD